MPHKQHSLSADHFDFNKWVSYHLWCVPEWKLSVFKDFCNLNGKEPDTHPYDGLWWYSVCVHAYLLQNMLPLSQVFVHGLGCLEYVNASFSFS